MSPFTPNDKQSGQSLIGVVVALALMGIMAPVVMQFASNSLKAAATIAQMGEEEDLRRLIRSRFSCERSTSGSQSSFRMLDRAGSPIAPLNKQGWHTLSKWKFRVESRSANGDLKVLVQKPGSANSAELFRKGSPVTCPG